MRCGAMRCDAMRCDAMRFTLPRRPSRARMNARHPRIRRPFDATRRDGTGRDGDSVSRRVLGVSYNHTYMGYRVIEYDMSDTHVSGPYHPSTPRLHPPSGWMDGWVTDSNDALVDADEGGRARSIGVLGVLRVFDARSVDGETGEGDRTSD